VEGDLSHALGVVIRLEEAPRLTVAGRTDAGVHARGQVVHVDLPEASWHALPGRSSRSPAESLVRRLAGLLRDDVVVGGAALAPAGFDARFSAIWRRYAYRVADADAPRDPLRRGHVLWLKPGHRLDVPAMDLAVAALVGEHDFLPFCRPREGATTIRTVQALRWERDADGLAVAHVQADAFCHHMVRALVGVSLAVGEGSRAPTWPAELLAAGRRDSAVPVVAAHGLTLEEVGYPPEELLAERASAARNRRA
jgi:tRNA pseudouridine38-40 synthase